MTPDQQRAVVMATARKRMADMAMQAPAQPSAPDAPQSAPQPLPSAPKVLAKIVGDMLPASPLTALAKYVAAPMAGEFADNPAAASRAVLDQGLQGNPLAGMSWSDEATDGLGASLAQLVNNPKEFFTSNDAQDPALVDALSGARQGTLARLASEESNQPATSMAAMTGGGILGGKALGSTKPLQMFADAMGKVGPAVGLGKAGSAVLQDMLSAAPAAAMYETGKAPDDNRLTADTALNTARDVALAGAASTVNQVAGKLKQVKPPIPTADEMRAQSSLKYQDAAQKGGVLTPQFTDDFLNELQTIKPKPIAGKLITSENKKILDSVEEFEQLRGSPLNLDDVQQLDESLGQKIDNFVDPKTGKVDKTGNKLLQMQSKLRDMVENAPVTQVVGGKDGFDALKDARKMWAQSRKLSDVERIMARAEQMDNTATGIKNGFRTLYNNPGRMRGYTADERALIQRAASGSIPMDTIRTVFGSKLLSGIYGLSGAGLGGALGASVASAGARGMATRIQSNQAANVARTIINGGRAPAQIAAPPLVKLLTP